MTLNCGTVSSLPAASLIANRMDHMERGMSSINDRVSSSRLSSDDRLFAFNARACLGLCIGRKSLKFSLECFMVWEFDILIC